MNFDQIQTYKGMHHSTVLRKYEDTVSYAFLLVRKMGANPWAVVKVINADDLVSNCLGRKSIALGFASPEQAKEFTSAGFTCVAGFDAMPSTEEEARAIIGFNGKPLTEFELNVLHAIHLDTQNNNPRPIYGFDKTQLNTQEIPAMNSSKNKRLCPDTSIALMATGDTFRIGYIEKIDLFGNAVVNCDGSFEVWSCVVGNYLFVFFMDKHTQQYSRCNNPFVSLHQKEIAMYAISQFVNKELRKQQHGSIYREDLPVWVESFEYDAFSRFRAIETLKATNASSPYDSSNWRNDPLAQQSVAQEQFKDLWKAPEQRPFLNMQQPFRTHNFQQPPQFEEQHPDKSVSMKPFKALHLEPLVNCTLNNGV